MTTNSGATENEKQTKLDHTSFTITNTNNELQFLTPTDQGSLENIILCALSQHDNRCHIMNVTKKKYWSKALTHCHKEVKCDCGELVRRVTNVEMFPALRLKVSTCTMNWEVFLCIRKSL